MRLYFPSVPIKCREMYTLWKTMKVGSKGNMVFLERRASDKSRVERHEWLKQQSEEDLQMLHLGILPILLMGVCRCPVLFLLFRESLINKRIESAVSQMQSVIELGRVIRDRKTMPVKASYHLHFHSSVRVAVMAQENPIKHLCWSTFSHGVVMSLCILVPTEGGGSYSPGPWGSERHPVPAEIHPGSK